MNSNPIFAFLVDFSKLAHSVSRGFAGIFLFAVAGMVAAHAGTTAWSTTPSSTDWNTAGDWTPSGVPAGGSALTFGATTTAGYTNNDDLGAGFSLTGITFTSAATHGYLITGNSISLASGNITNSSNYVDEIDDSLTTTTSATFTAGAAVGAGLTFGNTTSSGTLSNTGNGTTTFNGTGAIVINDNITNSGSSVGQTLTFTNTGNVTIGNTTGNSGGTTTITNTATGNQNFNFNNAGTVNLVSNTLLTTTYSPTYTFTNSGTTTISGSFSNSGAAQGVTLNLNGTGTSATTTTFSGNISETVFGQFQRQYRADRCGDRLPQRKLDHDECGDEYRIRKH
jgi:hypothetical protein